MQKETLTMANIANDLKSVTNTQEDLAFEYYGAPGVVIFLGAVLLGIFANWLWLLLLVFAIYPILRYVQEYKKHKNKKLAIEALIMRNDISISVNELSHISQETIYDPHRHGRHVHYTKEATFFCFTGGRRWRVPTIKTLYNWSTDYYITPKGLENISLEGDEFFYVSLQGYHDVSYIYPCKNFVLDSSLNIMD
jgi:hypothetical protein